ncbi:MAG: hypothetical protein Ct9H90mP30_2590 [Actinomycetota bacterium]|nr:MAG: hypothetical protein Ct9H90mP30_2590 [Actinomycetota bacterium]
MYAEVCSGLLEDPSHHLEKTFDVGHDHDELILVKSIPVYSLCEHHLLPFIGEAMWVTYRAQMAGLQVSLNSPA